MEGRLALLLVCLLLTAHAPVADAQRASLRDDADGQVFVYLQPLPPEAERVGFTLGAVSAVGAQGADIPLDLALPSITRNDVRHQRLIASGRVRATAYTALSFTIARASARRDGRDAALLVADTPVRIDVAFAVPRGKAVVVWLAFRPEVSIGDGMSFTPVFTAWIAPRPMQSLAGFVSNTQSNTITVFDKRLRQAAAVIPTGQRPSGLALDRQAGRLYVACEGDDEIQSIDVTSAELVDRTRLLPGDGPRELALTPDGRTLVSVNTGSNSISIFDTAPLTRRDRLGVGSGPGAMAIDPTGRRAFVFNTLSNSISVVDLTQRAVVATLSLDAAPLRGAFSARGDRLFVLYERSPYVAVVDPVKLSVVTRARLRIGIEALAVDERRNVIYMGGRDDNALEYYDPNTLLPTNTLRTGGGIAHLAIDAEDNSLYIVSPDRQRLLVGSLAERKVIAEIDVGKGPYWVAVMGER